MKKKFQSINAVMLAAVTAISAAALAGCNRIKIAEYPAARTSFIYEKDDSIPFLSAENAPVNPDRGFRGETYVTLGRGEAYPGSGADPYEYLDECLDRFSDDDIRLMQVYVYLIDYCDGELPESALLELKNYLTYLKAKGIKALLRFAYESDPDAKEGPSTRIILDHIETLGKFFDAHEELIDESIYAFQLGMIGLWGEGHSSVRRLNKRKIVRAVFETFPDDMFVMVRTPELLSLVPEEYEKRAGLHDDYLIGYSHEWGMMDFNDENYPRLLNKCKYALTDAEMPWGDQSPENMDMTGILRQAAGYGLTSFSIEHNYIEDGNEYLLKKWQSVYVDSKFLSDNGFPYNPALLTDDKISVYDYLKHHLGYQICFSNLSLESGKARFLITNYGFNAPYGYDLNVYSGGIKVCTESLDDLNIFSEKFIEVDHAAGALELEIVSRRTGAHAYPYNDLVRNNGKCVTA